MSGKTAKYYANNPSAREKKKEYDTEYHKTPLRKKYRAALNKANRRAGTYGKMKALGIDRSHTKDGKMVLEKSSTNRARNGEGGKGTKK